MVEEVTYSADGGRIDLVLFLNGIPVATLELKTDFTQSVQNAIDQYKFHRHPRGNPLLTYGRGAIVHMAVSPSEIYMTTRLEGKATFFLPFNKGHKNGAGNPPRTDASATAYLWEEILDPDTWLAIITKFVYTNKEERFDPITGKTRRKTQIRFPRYHQWRAVTRLVATAREAGPGRNYLIQHSAGSGKTDSIAWTAHQLASLHREDGEKVFDTVFVLADRQVLDKQLQEAVDQLVTRTGTFHAITRGTEGSKTKKLITALAAGVPIIGVTLQTFPHALQALNDPENQAQVAGKKFAVIADEAHSSQTGSAAEAVREVLYSADEPEIDLEEPGADQDALVRMAAHADTEQRLSYFAFTATPKAKTLEVFGEREPGAMTGSAPFDLYSMKQAIEEGFILDVLENYTSYEMAARIAQRAEDGKTTYEEDFDARKGTKTLIDFVELHPTNIASKVKVIIDHYVSTVQPHLGGRAKAMVVTSSRAAALQYHRALEKHISEERLPLKTLVAFSGEVPDPDVKALPGVDVPKVSETQANPQARGQDLADVFNQQGQNILVVASKYQTGFDQPALVAMYVDKKLSGIAAVQTLSRLNRRADGKTHTYVLDFVNDPDQILAAFKDYYEDAHLETESDPDLVADLLAKLDAQAIYTASEIDRVWDAWRGKSGAKTASGQHGRLDAALNAAVERFSQRWNTAVVEQNDEEKTVLQDFRTTLSQYVKAYAFFSQILHFQDTRYEKFSVFADLLARKLRHLKDDEPVPEAVDVSDVVLTHYRLEKVREEDLELSATEEGLRGMTEAGMAQIRERERVAKSELIDLVNKYFGDLNAEPEYVVNTLTMMNARLSENEALQVSARNNSKADFAYSRDFRINVEDALWREENDSDAALKAVRNLPWESLGRLLIEFGLYDELRQNAG